MPISAPPLPESSLFSASRSPNSPTQGPQVVNQKFTTVTALPENRSLLFTVFPSRSLPSKAGNFGRLLSSVLLPVLPLSVLLPVLPLSGVLPVLPLSVLLSLLPLSGIVSISLSVGIFISLSRDFCTISGYVSSSAASLFPMSRIFSASL